MSQSGADLTNEIDLPSETRFAGVQCLKSELGNSGGQLIQRNLETLLGRESEQLSSFRRQRSDLGLSIQHQDTGEHACAQGILETWCRLHLSCLAGLFHEHQTVGSGP